MEGECIQNDSSGLSLRLDVCVFEKRAPGVNCNVSSKKQYNSNYVFLHTIEPVHVLRVRPSSVKTVCLLSHFLRGKCDYLYTFLHL